MIKEDVRMKKWALRDTENYGKDTGNSIGDISECDRDLRLCGDHKGKWSGQTCDCKYEQRADPMAGGESGEKRSFTYS